MKKTLLISLPALLITGFIAITSVNEAVNTYKSVPFVESFTPIKTASKPLEAPLPLETQNVAAITEQPAQSVATVPTNEELIERYGWNVGPYRDSINVLMKYYPQFFTDEMREKSFKYIEDVSPSREEGYISYFYIIARQGNYNVKAWINLGKKAGVDTSLYE